LTIALSSASSGEFSVQPASVIKAAGDKPSEYLTKALEFFDERASVQRSQTP
jgi:hypothetical protein